jgi:hypothetical protein
MLCLYINAVSKINISASLIPIAVLRTNEKLKYIHLIERVQDNFLPEEPNMLAEG